MGFLVTDILILYALNIFLLTASFMILCNDLVKPQTIMSIHVPTQENVYGAKIFLVVKLLSTGDQIINKGFKFQLFSHKRMISYTRQLYKNAYTGLSRNTWYLSLVMLINRSGTM